MPVTASQVFSFLEREAGCSVERHEIASATFGSLRRSLRQIVLRLRECDDQESLEVSDRLRSLLSGWLTVPVPFDRSMFDEVAELLGSGDAVQVRWGRDIRMLYDTALQAARQLPSIENPVREKLRAVIREQVTQKRTFKIYCDRRARRHFESLFAPSSDSLLSEDTFLHSVSDYRESAPVDVLIKVGPLRTRGWGSAPDALLTAPRFITLAQVVWAGCGDEPDFGYDPALPPADATAAEGHVPVAVTNTGRSPMKWSTRVIRSGEDPGAVAGYAVDADELRVFRQMNQRHDNRLATLVQVDDKHGILYPPHAKVLSFDPSPAVREAIAFRILSETLVEGMYLIRPVVDDVDFGGIRAKHGQCSQIWKATLKLERERDALGLIKRLREAGLILVHLGTAIGHWCEPPTTVIHAPQQMRHFEILVKVLGLDNEGTAMPGVPWWRWAWAEIGRSRGEAVQAGVQEQEIVEEQLIGILQCLLPQIRENTATNDGFHIDIPARPDVHGSFVFFKVSAIEHEFHVPEADLKVVRELKVIEQWRD